MKYTTDDIIKYILEKNKDIKQAFSDRKLADVFSDPNFQPGEIKVDRKYYDDDGDFVQFQITSNYKDVYRFEYDKGYLIYIDVNELDSWYLQKNREILLKELGID